MASQSELYSLALSQGLTPERARIAAAVGMGESGGNARAHNTNAATGDNSYGYWQINMLGALGPARRALLGISSNNELFKPEVNARAMKLISANGTNFNPWSVYKSKDYLKYMPNDVTDQGSSDPSWTDKIPVVGGAIDGASSIAETLTKTARWVSNSENWVRVGYVAGGSVLVIAGLVMVVQSTSLGRAATNLVPAGRIAKAARK